MIPVTRLRGQTVAINPDLIESIEENPDTHIRLTSGEVILVRETLDELVDKVMQYKRYLISAFSLDPSQALANRTRPPAAPHKE